MAPFADRLSALVDERRSQICLGLDPDPARLIEVAGGADASPAASTSAPAKRAGAAVAAHCISLIERAGPSCVAIKPQLACFERLGSNGWAALEEVTAFAQSVGLLVIADGKRGDVPVSASVYGQALVGEVETPWGTVAGLGVDAFTANPLMGRDSLEPLIEAAQKASAGIFILVRTSNPGAADIEDLESPGGPVHEQLASIVNEFAPRLAGSADTSAVGAVVGATEPQHLPRLRELMPSSIFLLPGVGAQGGKPAALGPAFAPGPAAALVTASRGISTASDPAEAAAALRDTVWAISGG